MRASSSETLSGRQPSPADAIGGADDPNAGTVHSALLTTYDLPDPVLLVEEILPRWFNLDREASSDDAANRLFLVELVAELQRRQGRLSIFSSAVLLGQQSQHWIWSHVNRHFTGVRGPAVQHAKLWLLHRINGDGVEHVDIHVSSTNLTRSAVREQLQAGFRCRAQVWSTTSKSALSRWGSLVPFLEELGSHSGPAGIAAVTPWLDLLARCRCPEGITFVGSIPGTHSGHGWGVRALGGALRLPARTEVDILVPTVRISGEAS
jgi:tyrosyl-DNA phosphodiesterase